MEEISVLKFDPPILLPKCVQIPAGYFLMGCDSGQDNEKPVHNVRLDEFFMATLQVTNADYARFLDYTRRSLAPPPFWSDPDFNHPQQPVVGVSWHDATHYCEWLMSLAGEATGTRTKFRLPTEAEWELAARGGLEGALYPWGDAPPQSLLDYAERCAKSWRTGPEQVGLSEPNSYALHNMCDNVHEWCSDWYGADYYAASPDRNPLGPQSGARRASRGGSWRHHIKISRCGARSSIPPDFKYSDYGFRVAHDAIKE
jgi:formylglycine-generating enzyme required for sulfatase activity